MNIKWVFLYSNLGCYIEHLEQPRLLAHFQQPRLLYRKPLYCIVGIIVSFVKTPYIIINSMNSNLFLDF